MTASIESKTKAFWFFLVLFVLSAPFSINAQARRSTQKTPMVKRAVAPATAVVVDERLSVLRFEPSLYAIPMQRMRSGRTMQITGEKTADGVKFYRVQLPPEKTGWVQADAVVTNARIGDDERLARLIRASEGFDQIELATIFLENFPKSVFRPAILLLLGDLLEETAQRLAREAFRRLDQNHIQASGAPVHSFYLNYSGLDRYRRLGVNFVFASETKQFHHDGAAWREIVQKHPNSAEAVEARKRLESLTTAMK